MSIFAETKDGLVLFRGDDDLDQLLERLPKTDVVMLLLYGSTIGRNVDSIAGRRLNESLRRSGIQVINSASLLDARKGGIENIGFKGKRVYRLKPLAIEACERLIKKIEAAL